MTDWARRVREAALTPADAVARIGSDQTIVVGGSNAEPRALVGGLLERDDLTGVKALTWPGGFPSRLCDPRFDGAVTVLLPVPNRHTRAALASGQAEHVPGSVHRALERLADGRPRVDGALVTVSPPDASGWCSLGTSVLNLGPACEVAGYVIAEVNDRMPRTCGEGRIHVDRIDALVQVSDPLPEIAPSRSTTVAEAIAEQVASLVPDGATIECGIGTLPDAVLGALHGHRDLAIHSGIIGDGLIGLADSGALRAPSADGPPVVCAGSVLGSSRLYEWVHENPLVQMRSGRYTHDPRRMAEHDRFVAINGAIELDLTGQVNAEVVDGALVAGVGGQGDFARGARLSSHGLNVLVLPSTARRGSKSRLVARLDDGVPVAMPRGEVQWVVTEHGAVDLEGLTLADRARALISIADPAFRAELDDAAGLAGATVPT